MTKNRMYAETRAGLLEQLQKHKVVTAAYVSSQLGTTRQRINWHLQRLAEEGLAHHAQTITVGSRHYVWVLGKTTRLSEGQLRAKVLELHTKASSPGAEANTQHKTTFVGGINPWTGGKMK